MKLSLGPVLYYWEHDQLADFYEQAATWPVDIVYLGEVVCSKRHTFRIEDWLEVAEQLVAAGKEVVLSSMALIESESDLKTLRRLAENEKFSLEANDMGAVKLATGKKFVVGPHLNTYNPQTLEILGELGAKRWVMPVDMSGNMLAELLTDKPDGMETEVFAYGRLPLAFSARCFTARHYNLPKDDCQFRCLDHAYGMTLSTREGQPFLALNGIQTQSSSVYNLLPEIENMRGMVDILRISPQPQDTDQVLSLFRKCLDGTISPVEANAELIQLMPDQPCDGYWHGKAGLEQSPNAIAGASL